MRPVIYQLFTRLFNAKNTPQVFSGTLAENGCGKFNDFTEKALLEIADLGITHLWFTGIIDHATSTDYPESPADAPEILKGRAGSPYAIRDYYDVAPDLAENYDNRMAEFESLLERTHNAGLKAVIDFIPNHVARSYHSKSKNSDDLGKNDDTSLPFSPQNNFYYLTGETFNAPENIAPFGPDQEWKSGNFKESPAKATGNDCFSAQPSIYDWYETIKLNYGIDYQNGNKTYFDPIPNTWTKMRDILLFWAQKGIDAFRCDMAEMVPVEFWAWAIPAVKAEFNDILFIAEIYQEEKYNAFISRGKFDYLYDKVGLYDTLRAVVEQKKPASAITQCWQKLHGLDQHMLTFMENHDEQRVASRFFANDGCKGVPAMAVSALLNTGSTLIYAGQELGEKGDGATGFGGDDGRSTIFDYATLPALHRWINGGAFNLEKLSAEEIRLRKSYQTILKLVNGFELFKSGKFYDLMWFNETNPHFDRASCYAFVRYTSEQAAIVVANFSGHVQNCKLRLGNPLFDTFETPTLAHYRSQDLLNGKEENWNTESAISDGIPLQIEAYGVYIQVFKLLP